MEKKYYLLENNYDSFIKMNNLLLNLDINASNINKNISLKKEEIIDICKKIIKELNEDYLKKFNQIIDKIFFSDEIESRFKIPDTIIIKKGDSFQMIVDLIHEFIHYTNYCNGVSINRDNYGELISIYFELIAIKYLQDKYGINLFYNRIFETKKLAMMYETKTDYFDIQNDSELFKKREFAYFTHLLGMFGALYLYNNGFLINNMIYLNDNIQKFNGDKEIMDYMNINNFDLFFKNMNLDQNQIKQY